MNCKMFTPFQWTVIILLGVIALIVFTKTKSNFSGPNTIFEMNELKWIPTDIRTLMKDRINDDIVPSLSLLAERSWNSGTPSEQTSLLQSIDDIFTELKTKIDESFLSISPSQATPS